MISFQVAKNESVTRVGSQGASARLAERPDLHRPLGPFARRPRDQAEDQIVSRLILLQRRHVILGEFGEIHQHGHLTYLAPGSF